MVGGGDVAPRVYFRRSGTGSGVSFCGAECDSCRSGYFDDCIGRKNTPAGTKNTSDWYVEVRKSTG